MTAAVAAPAFDFIVFNVADLDASFRFFKDQLGFTHVPEGEPPDFRQFAIGDGGMGFGLALAKERTPQPGAVELYLKSSDLPALHAAWTANGVAASPIVQMPFGPMFEVTTPDGRKLSLIG